MSALLLLSVAHMCRIEPFFPTPRGLRRVDDRRVISGVIYEIRHGLQWKDAPRGYGPYKTLYNRFVRWSRLGVFDRIFAALVAQAGVPRAADDRQHAPQGPPHRRQYGQKRGSARCIGRTKGGLNSKLHAVCNGRGRLVRLLLTAGQTSDHLGAAVLLPELPAARELIADRGYNSAAYRARLIARSIEPTTRSTRSRKIPIPHNRALYRHRHRIENAFGTKDWRRIATRHDRCADTFQSAIATAARSSSGLRRES